MLIFLRRKNMIQFTRTEKNPVITKAEAKETFSATDILIMTVTARKSDAVNLTSLAEDTQITMLTVKESAEPSRISSVAVTQLTITRATKSAERSIRFLALAIQTMIRMAKRSAAATLSFLVRDIITAAAVAMLQPVFMDHMIAPKCGLSADSVIIPLQNPFSAEPLSGYIMPSVPQS